MKNWFTSLNGAITLSVVALLTFLGRGFLDWRYEYPLQDPTGSWDTLGALVYMALAGGWIWSLLAAARSRRRGLIVGLILALLLDVALALATYFILCPPWTGCEGWPNAWPWNWANLITGLLSSAAIVMYLRQNPAES
ncbi:MAG TPA: hypothetical protein VLA49_17685 [Anaerolineales bacterium]|nr:hypothetical protein [Anaerolineales bacterium]